MRLSRAMIVMRKDWRELRSNTLLLVSMFALPVVLTLVPIVLVAISLVTVNDKNAGEMMKEIGPLAAQIGASTPKQLVVKAIATAWMGMFLMLPVFVPIVISAQAIVGEKEKRTIEPLLAAPIHASELLFGKTLAAVVPGVVITWLAFLVFAGVVDFLAWPAFHGLVLPDLAWAISMLLTVPMLAMFGNGLAVVISSRVNDARLAQQLAGLAVLPLVASFVVQMTRGVLFGPWFYLLSTLGLALVNVVLYLAAVRLFDRERILTSLR